MYRVFIVAAICCLVTFDAAFAVEPKSCQLGESYQRTVVDYQRGSRQVGVSPGTHEATGLGLPGARLGIRTEQDVRTGREAYDAALRSVDNCPCGDDCNCPPGVCDAGLCKKTYVVMFTAPWCGPCRDAHRPVERLQAEGYSILFVDVDQNPGVNQKYKFSAIPTFVAFNDGKEVSRNEGYPGDQWLKDHSKPAPEPQPEPKPKEVRYDL